jgi:copper chaperone CopZ
MKNLFMLIVAISFLGTTAAAGQVEYDLEVDGMVCAYCAYNVSKQLTSIDGVVPQSVNVNLEKGSIRLRSDKDLRRTQVADLLLQAGFTLVDLTKSVASTPQPGPRADEILIMSLTMSADRVENGEFEDVLDALGDIAMQRSGRVSVIAPADLETTILKPVLAGRRTVIKVNYDRATRADQNVVVSVSESHTASAR